MPQLAAGKRRYNVTLTVANVERLQRVAKRLGMPQNIMSLAFDDTAREMAVIFEKMAEKGTVTTLDFFKLLGQQMLEFDFGEKGGGNVLQQKRNTVPKL